MRLSGRKGGDGEKNVEVRQTMERWRGKKIVRPFRNKIRTGGRRISEPKGHKQRKGDSKGPIGEVGGGKRTETKIVRNGGKVFKRKRFIERNKKEVTVYT